MRRRYHIVLLSFLFFVYFLFDSALNEYLDDHISGFYKDVLYALSSLSYILLMSLLIVKIIKPQISIMKMYFFIIIYLLLYIMIRFYLIGFVFV